MNKEQAAAVYAILIDACAAPVSAANAFVQEFSSKTPTGEWRFSGSLGFGGKFRFPALTVDCYIEDSTPERRETIRLANARLEAWKLGKENATLLLEE